MKRLFGKAKQEPMPSGRRHPTGTPVSARSFSYYASSRTATRQQEETARRRGEEPPKRRWHLPMLWRQVGHNFSFIVLALLLVVCAVSVLQVDTKPRVVILNDTEGYALHDTSAYQAAATNVLRGSFLNSNKITIDTNSVAEAVKQQFPEVADASIALPLVGHRPTLYIQLTQPTLILMTGSQSVVVDSAGQALVTADNVRDLARFNLPTLVDQSHLRPQVGDVVLSSSTVAFIRTVLAQFAAAHVATQKLVLPSAAEELDVYPRGAAYYGKFNLHETNARQQVGTFLAVRQQLAKGKGTLPHSYIDVRIAGRAYYQ